jgi:hypothetical protein
MDNSGAAWENGKAVRQPLDNLPQTRPERMGVQHCTVMPRTTVLTVILLGFSLCNIWAVETLRAAEEEPGPATVDYVRQVKPILKQRCYGCHGALKHKAGLRLDTASAIRRGGDGGPAIEPGQAGESLIVERVTGSDPAERMPPEGPGLTAEQVAIVCAWIDQGAAAPADEQPEADPRRHWAFVPPVRPGLPEVGNKDWDRNPIDAFLASEHQRLGLVPLGPAEPQVLLRRVYLDLIGLPPTREQLHEFLADPSEAAYRRIVERLLASPQHGERWARHWMDVWRYSDWYGRRAVPDVLNSYAQIWRWRDWIVRALNEDKGYDRMVCEMLAADELAPCDEANLAATGFLVRNFYRWNYNSWMKDNVEHTGKAFLGLTINCAHCHDHKYDPITQEDYFAFRAIFEPLELRHDRMPGEPDPGPYPKYEYGKAYKPITSGMVRVFDEKLDAQTFLYTWGESRNIVPGRPPIAPGVPGFLDGHAFRVQAVELPPDAAFPGLKAFVQHDELARAEAALAEAERAWQSAQDFATSSARTLVSTQARLAPDNVWAFADPLCVVLAFPEPLPPAPELEQARGAAEGARLALEKARTQFESAGSGLVAIRARIAADIARHGTTPASDLTLLSRLAARAERQAAAARAAAEHEQAEFDLWLARGMPGAQVQKNEQRLIAAGKALEQARAAVGQDSLDYTPISPTYPSRSTGRRTALARWITDRGNPLTARVAVNHVWRWHFGTPLVATTYDFGRNGAAPTHRELLDWLAVELMEPTAPGVAPWSLKALHRLIVTSAAYRMGSHPDPAEARSVERRVDPANRWLWHFPPARMEAETVRDSLLHLAGALDPTLGGPDIDLAEGLTARRRSLYFTHHGEARMPFLELFDAADACDAYRRTTTVIPQQALALTNNELLLDLSETLAERLWAAAGDVSVEETREAAFLTAAWEQILTRPPTPRERAIARGFLARQAALLERGSAAAGDPRTRSRRDLVHALFSHNDFLTIH